MKKTKEKHKDGPLLCDKIGKNGKYFIRHTRTNIVSRKNNIVDKLHRIKMLLLELSIFSVLKHIMLNTEHFIIRLDVVINIIISILTQYVHNSAAYVLPHQEQSKLNSYKTDSRRIAYLDNVEPNASNQIKNSNYTTIKFKIKYQSKYQNYAINTRWEKCIKTTTPTQHPSSVQQCSSVQERSFIDHWNKINQLYRADIIRKCVNMIDRLTKLYIGKVVTTIPHYLTNICSNYNKQDRKGSAFDRILKHSNSPMWTIWNVG
ncbi:hypothetical protein AGLY_006921 [Aphis glycines]|uniref:Uncharacterized protein n=1 Tax=Aphis glycines TaxID=307491 RepID=A0A6G0TSC3_APHGL|nr:hypothetical protein AGLY_006921 [Aphis glycines]